MVLLGDEPHVEARFGPFGDRASLDVDRCTVCAERTIGLETVLDAPMVLLGDEAHVHARFGLFRDSTSLDARCMVCAETYHSFTNRIGRT